MCCMWSPSELSTSTVCVFAYIPVKGHTRAAEGFTPLCLVDTHRDVQTASLTNFDHLQLYYERRAFRS